MFWRKIYIFTGRLEMKRLLLGTVLVVGAFAYGNFSRPKEPETHVAVTVYPAMIEKFLQNLKLEAGTSNITLPFRNDVTKDVTVWGHKLGTIRFEQGSFTSYGVVHAGFPAGSIRVVQASNDLIALNVEAPEILALEDKMVTHDHDWISGLSDPHFQDESRRIARAQLLDTACHSERVAIGANTAAKEELPLLVRKFLVQKYQIPATMRFDVITTMPAMDRKCIDHLA